MKLSDTNLSVQDREWVERELPPGEELLLVCKPATSLWKPGYAYRMFFATLWNAFLFGILGSLIITHTTLEKIIEKPAFLLLFLGLLPFYLIGIGFIISPWWERENDRRTVYALTNQRAIVLRPSMLRRRRTCRSFPLAHDLIKEVREYRHGRGDIIMGHEEHHGRHGIQLIPQGFLFVDHVYELAALIRPHLPDAPAPETEETPGECPTLGCMPVIVLLFAVIYLTTRYKQGTSDGVDIALIFGGIALYSIISWSIKYAAWRKGQAEQKGN